MIESLEKCYSCECLLLKWVRGEKTGFNCKLHLVSEERKQVSNYIDAPLTTEQWEISSGKNVRLWFFANNFYNISASLQEPYCADASLSSSWAIFPSMISKTPAYKYVSSIFHSENVFLEQLESYENNWKPKSKWL